MFVLILKYIYHCIYQYLIFVLLTLYLRNGMVENDQDITSSQFDNLTDEQRQLQFRSLKRQWEISQIAPDNKPKRLNCSQSLQQNLDTTNRNTVEADFLNSIINRTFSKLPTANQSEIPVKSEPSESDTQFDYLNSLNSSQRTSETQVKFNIVTSGGSPSALVTDMLNVLKNKHNCEHFQVELSCGRFKLTISDEGDD